MIKILDFWATWCGPCKFMEPIIEEIEKELHGKIEIEKINVDENQELTAKHGVMSIPTYIIEKDGKEQERIVGATQKDNFLKTIKNMNDPFPLVIANHKANKTWDEVKSWIDEVGPAANDFKGTIVFCPSFPFIAASYELIKSKNYNIKLGTQDISFFDQGPYTGEVAATQLKGLVSYSLIGHSERRQNFNEDAARLQNKLVNAQKADISAILCLQTENTPILNDVAIVAYEPTFAIGSGNPDTLTNIELVAKRIKEKGPYVVLYGGSVSGDNVGGIMLLGVIDGVLVGASHSLDPQKFIAILKAIH